MDTEMNAADDLESRVLDLAHQAIGHQAGGDHRQAVHCWAQAIALADAGMHDDEIRGWLRSGIAEAHEAIDSGHRDGATAPSDARAA
jgi:hypothetical protein